MSIMNTATGKGTGLIKKLRSGFLSKVFNAEARDNRRITKELKNMNARELREAITNGIKNPTTGETQKLKGRHLITAELQRLKLAAHLRHPVPK